jgi:hypothetical protein
MLISRTKYSFGLQKAFNARAWARVLQKLMLPASGTPSTPISLFSSVFFSKNNQLV